MSKDIGVNGICIHGCRYCNTTVDHGLALRRYSEHDCGAPSLWGRRETLLESAARVGQGRPWGAAQMTEWSSK